MSRTLRVGRRCQRNEARIRVEQLLQLSSRRSTKHLAIPTAKSANEESTFEGATSSASAAAPPAPAAVESHTTALLTPIATVLKSDRLGIGLKAKTVGPYKASKKRVTHNQAALAAHIRANEEMRRRKAITGRGTRGFARLAKAEAEQRRQLLASLNSG
ncbi:hypothetical protein NM688_g7787 [Phlebia brevispora]|uniref:Uncharacterized protein n=1 Tax=Phlebia brevispora TaxID=194682 RepID=A0ACC1S137_9APHY|nr:hypothetical protein NM688_g7787 [Phlebia brevispora]